MKPKGILLIIGGAEDKSDDKISEMEVKNAHFRRLEVLQQVLPRHKESMRVIEVIATASSMPDEMHATYKKAFRNLGFKEVGFIPIQDREQARDESYRERIAKSHAVFFTGGDQFTLSAVLAGTPVLHAIREKYMQDSRFVVAGTSAGAMALPRLMIAQGGIEEALLQTDLRMSAGLGIADGYIVDTHFIQRGRFGRLAHAVIMNPEALGIGLGEDTAMLIRKGTDAECVGSGSVIIIDGQEVGQTNMAEVDEHTPIFVENLRVHILCNGCRFSLEKRMMARPARASGQQTEKAAK